MQKVKLTKTDFIQYLNCPKSLWILKNHPEEYPHGEFSLFLEKLIKEGYEVEEYAKKLFPRGIGLPTYSTSEETKKAMSGEGTVFFQASFETSEGVFARVDILEKNPDDTFTIYEVKSSTEVKTNNKHNHIKDACFQRFVLEANGHKVSKVCIIHLNKEYIRKGDVQAGDLLHTEDVTEKVDEIFEEISEQISEATKILSEKKIDKDVCSCKRKTRSNHCDTFRYFNKEIPDYPVYEIIRISQKKIWHLVDEGLLDIVDVHPEFELNGKQKLQVQSAQIKKPIVDQKTIAKKLATLKSPLHFIDYETYASAVPKIDGVKPHQHIAFQVSVHTLGESGDLSHFEFLANELTLPKKLITAVSEFTGSVGTFISWHASFEKTINKNMIEMLPEQADYLKYMNENMFDLEDVFKTDYVDYRFRGSTSIKKVLPVIIPNLSYRELKVRDGTMALDLWGQMVLDPEFDEDKVATQKALLEYCKLDTFAMVEIYNFLKKF